MHSPIFPLSFTPTVSAQALSRSLRSSLLTVATIILASIILTACAKGDEPDDVAVATMPVAEMQATNFLPLNDDKPGTFVTVERYLVPGKFTIVLYYSPFDETSANIIPRLAELTKVRNDIAVRTVNVNRPNVEGIDWESPILEGTRVQNLPYFQIYDRSRAMRAQARPAYEQIMQWIQPRPM